MSTKKILFAEIAIILFLIISYFASDIWAYLSKKELLYTPADRNSSLNISPCELVLQDGSKLVVAIAPKEIFPLQKTEFTVKIADAEIVYMTVFCLNMNMGVYEFPFKKEKDGLFRANIVLPACSAKAMKWQADIKVQKKGKLYGGGFLFESKN